MVELLKAALIEAAVTGPGVGGGAPATGEPHDVVARAAKAPTTASARR
jgi:hypothetical protein